MEARAAFYDESGELVVGEQLAYQGCGDPGPLCSQIDGRCVGWHCPHCGAPCSSQGHDCPER
jgi:hypothetical protein